MIRRILLASAGALALSGAAFAADLPSRAPPPVYLPPPPLWTGFYLGMNAGGTWSNSNNVNTTSANLFAFPGPTGGPNLASAITSLANFNAPTRNNAGFIGGGQIGYNYQFANSWVAGIEADFQGVAGSRGTTKTAATLGVPGFPNSVTEFASISRSLDYLGTVRGRVGYLVTPTLLIYGTGGLAYGGVNSSTGLIDTLAGPNAVFPNPWFSFGKVSSTRIGWTAGGGVEWMFLPNWSAKAEYLYYDLGSATYSGGVLLTNAAANSPFTINSVHSSTRFSGNVVRAGLNYHFNWGAPPVVARY
jgi:outer membrane immunogenic protein